ncbi:hypothetical protein [Catellatospora vulcania]|uniref:hypothetical protein n=1 Tax=Catellatospora vulcania TaxID=1460450 RepID=UPI0012D37AE1|nr:hypothetical protein [Catellatospora vulcania]
MKLRAAIFLALAAIGLSLVTVIAPAEPAWACSCAWAAGPEQDSHAQRIVVGTVEQVTDQAIRLVVDSVEKGDAAIGETVALRVGRSEASCGYEFRVGIRYRVNTSNGVTGLCNGVVPAPAPPSASPVSTLTTDPTPAVAEPGPARTSSPWLFVAGALLVIIVAGLAAAGLRRRRAAGR